VAQDSPLSCATSDRYLASVRSPYRLTSDPVFREEDGHGDAVAAVDLQFPLGIGVLVAVEGWG